MPSQLDPVFKRIVGIFPALEALDGPSIIRLANRLSTVDIGPDSGMFFLYTMLLASLVARAWTLNANLRDLGFASSFADRFAEFKRIPAVRDDETEVSA